MASGLLKNALWVKITQKYLIFCLHIGASFGSQLLNGDKFGKSKQKNASKIRKSVNETFLPFCNHYAMEGQKEEIDKEEIFFCTAGSKISGFTASKPKN